MGSRLRLAGVGVSVFAVTTACLLMVSRSSKEALGCGPTEVTVTLIGVGSMEPGQQITLGAQGSPEAGGATYEWSASGGTIEGNEDTATLTAGSDTGEFEVSVTYTHPKYGSAVDTKKYYIAQVSLSASEPNVLLGPLPGECLVEMEVTVDCGETPSGIVTVQQLDAWFFGGGLVRGWEARSMGQEYPIPIYDTETFDDPNLWEPAANVPSPIYLEGLRPSVYPNFTIVGAWYDPDPNGEASRVYYSDPWLYIEVDAPNCTNGQPDPDVDLFISGNGTFTLHIDDYDDGETLTASGEDLDDSNSCGCPDMCPPDGMDLSATQWADMQGHLHVEPVVGATTYVYSKDEAIGQHTVKAIFHDSAVQPCCDDDEGDSWHKTVTFQTFKVGAKVTIDPSRVGHPSAVLWENDTQDSAHVAGYLDPLTIVADTSPDSQTVSPKQQLQVSGAVHYSAGLSLCLTPVDKFGIC